MAFTMVTVTGTVLNLQDQPEPGATVSFTLNTAITDGTNLVAALPQTTTAGANGSFSLEIAANDDATTTPTGSFYVVQVTDAVGALIVTFNATVKHSYAPSITLFALMG